MAVESKSNNEIIHQEMASLQGQLNRYEQLIEHKESKIQTLINDQYHSKNLKEEN